MTGNRASAWWLGLYLGGIHALALYQLALLGFARVGEFAPGLLFNAWACGWLWLLGELALRTSLRALVLVPVLCLLFALGLVAAHGWFFDVASERKLTLLDMTPAGVRYFFEVALPPHGRLALLAVFVGSAVSAWSFSRALPAISRRGLGLTALALALSLPLVLRAPKIVSPLFDSALEFWEIATLPRVTPGEPKRAWLDVLDQGARTRGLPPSAYKHVIVLVMETMTAEQFGRESELLATDAFLKRERAHVHAFARYFPNNQDSRTGMLDMLFSRVIPYEAYSDHGYARYRGLVRKESLVERMRELSYRTAFAVSQTTLEDVVGELAWDQTLRLSDAQIERARAAKMLCFTPDEYEKSCEDLALLPSVVDFVASHERSFVYQEFIWGHAAEYNEASGKSNARYYSDYVDALLAALAARGLADDTLIALTSDHGFRDKGRQHDPEAYRVPLWFYAPRLGREDDPRLTSHVDFGRLLFELLTPAAPRVPSNPLVLIVGPTGQGHLFALSGEGGHLLLREKLGRFQLVAREGAWQAGPESVLATFEQYRARFDRELGAAR